MKADLSRESFQSLRPLLSIITPTYNAAKYVAACIDSVRDQQCSSVEHIVVDGASQDGTAEVVRARASKLGYLKFLSERDRGQSDAMNKGLRISKGEYVSFLNVDDFYEAGALNRVIEIIRSLDKPRFIVGACNTRGEGDRILEVNRPRILDRDYLLAGWPFPINPTSYFYPRWVHELAGYYDIEDHYVMDLKFILAAFAHVEPLYVDEVLGNFRLIPGTKTHSIISNSTLGPRQKRVYDEQIQELPAARRARIEWLKIILAAKKRYWRISRMAQAAFHGNEV